MNTPGNSQKCFINEAFICSAFLNPILKVLNKNIPTFRFTVLETKIPKQATHFGPCLHKSRSYWNGILKYINHTNNSLYFAILFSL